MASFTQKTNPYKHLSGRETTLLTHLQPATPAIAASFAAVARRRASGASGGGASMSVCVAQVGAQTRSKRTLGGSTASIASPSR